MDNAAYIRKFPDTCSAEVSRGGFSQPCDKPAVAVATNDEMAPDWWPVCAHHTRKGGAVLLRDLIAALAADQ